MAGTARRTARRCGAGILPMGRAPATAEVLAEEVPVALSYNGEVHAVMLASPGDLEDFALGFSLTQGIITHPGELESLVVRGELAGIELAMRIPAARAALLVPDARRLAGSTGCGLCGQRRMEDAVRWPGAVTATHRFDGAAIHLALAGLRARQLLFDATGATHAAGWSLPNGEMLLAREDVGRHNALDKLIGALAAGGRDAGEGFIVVTSRASVEMVMKAASAGVGLMAAVSAPTALAVTLADSTGMSLLGFARDGRHTVYAHAWRLRDDAPQIAPEARHEH